MGGAPGIPPAGEERPAAAQSTAARRLDADHVGAQLGEYPPRVDADLAGEVEHAHAGKRPSDVGCGH